MLFHAVIFNRLHDFCFRWQISYAQKAQRSLLIRHFLHWDSEAIKKYFVRLKGGYMFAKPNCLFSPISSLEKFLLLTYVKYITSIWTLQYRVRFFVASHPIFRGENLIMATNQIYVRSKCRASLSHYTILFFVTKNILGMTVRPLIRLKIEPAVLNKTN